MEQYNHDWIMSEWIRMGGPEVEILIRGTASDWVYCPDPSFSGGYQYRIKSKPWINWEHVHESVVAMATDKNGSTKFYAHAPDRDFLIGQRIWRGDSFPLGEADILVSFTQGTCNWRDSLVMRPTMVSDE